MGLFEKTTASITATIATSTAATVTELPGIENSAFAHYQHYIDRRKFPLVVSQ